jgi:hypothetical protein
MARFFIGVAKTIKDILKDKNLIINPSRRFAPQDERNKKMNDVAKTVKSLGACPPKF